MALLLTLAVELGPLGGHFSRSGTGQESDHFNKLYGVDIAKGMLDICDKGDWYQELFVEPMQNFISKLTGGVDHIVSLSALLHLTPEELTFVLVRCFQLARKSITITVDEIPDEYNEALRKQGLTHMHSENHIKNVKAMGEPPGWRLAYLCRQFGRVSPATKVKVYTTVFHFDRFQEEPDLTAYPGLNRYESRTIIPEAIDIHAKVNRFKGAEVRGASRCSEI
jgi:hypothetical protein